tara:strand:+ start:127 stop:480 length:354 start_codon:yes stop_codon:yes gene_type:complete
MEGLNTMRAIRRSRTDAPVSTRLGEHLGKTLSSHQVLPAVQSSKAGLVSNLARVKKPNLPASSTGGLRRDITQTHNANDTRHRVMNHSFTDGQALQKIRGIQHTLIRPAHGIKAGGH